MRLVALAAEQVHVFVGLEVREPDDHLLGKERGRDRRHAFDDFLHVELGRAGIPADALFDVALELCRLVGEFEQRLGVDADVAGDDEFQARQAHAFVRQALELEGELGIADVHHDLGRRRRHLVQTHIDDVDGQRALVHMARVALGAGDRHGGAIGQHARRIAAAHDGRNAELARDDRGVAGAPAAVGDDGRRALHHRLPIRVGHVGDQNITRLDAVHFGGRLDEAHVALPDLLAYGAAARQNRGLRLQPITAKTLCTFILRLHRFRARLQDVQMSVLAVAAPFDVHRTAVVLLDHDRAACELDRFVIGDRKAEPFGFGNIDGDRRIAHGIRLRERHLERLAADGLAQNCGPL